MPQGARGWWVRAARIGLSAVLCAGAIGCMNTDNHKPPPRIGANPKNTTLPPPGLPGLQPLPNSSGSPVGTNTRPGQPNFSPTGAGAVQPAGGFATGPGTMQPPPRTIGQPVTPPSQVTPAGYQQPAPLVPSAAPVVPPVGPGSSNPQGARNFDPPPLDLSIPGGPVPPAPPAQPGFTSSSNYGAPIAPPPPVAPTRPPAVYGEVSTGVYQMSK
jgi:hypothetical protein